MNKEKVEYMERLFPYIDNRRKYERLVNAQIRPTIIKSDVDAVRRDEIKNFELDLTEGDYREAYKDKPIVHCDLKVCENYDDFFKLSNFIKWNDGLLNTVADYIYKNPTCLPYFLEFNALVILGGLFGSDTFFSTVYDRFSCDKAYIWWPPHIMADEYAWGNYLAKYRLSLFLSVLDKLLDRGMNLAAFRFTYLERETVLGDILTGTPWYEPIKGYIPSEGYNIRDVLNLSEETLASLISFDDLLGFLGSIMTFVEMDHYHVYNDRTMLNPSMITPIATEQRFFDITKSSVIDYLYEDSIPEGFKVDVLEVCRRFSNKLQAVADKTKYDLVSRRLEELRRPIVTAASADDLDWSRLNEQFQKLYDDIAKLPTHVQTDLIKDIEKLAHQKKIDIKIQKPVSLEMRVRTLEEQVALHSSQIEELDRRVSSLEEALTSIYDYIDNGTPLPANTTDYISKRHMMRIITHPAKDKMSSLRKSLIIGALTLGTLVLLNSSNVLTNKAETPVFPSAPIVTAPPSNRVGTTDEVVITPFEPTESDTPEPSEPVELYEQVEATSKPYYHSIYDEVPTGRTFQSGYTIRYYLLQDGQYVTSFDTAPSLKEFVAEQGENMMNFTWKAAVCSLPKETIEHFIAAGEPVPAEYTTFFIDYTPSLDFAFDEKNPTI